jgi:hypothetical protein
LVGLGLFILRYKDAVAISMYVMIAGVVALIFLRLKKTTQ